MVKRTDIPANLHVKEIQSGKRQTLEIPLEKIKRVTVYNDGERFNIIAGGSFYNLVLKDVYNLTSELVSKEFAKSDCQQKKIQFILYNYSSTVSSMEQILKYAKANDLLVFAKKADINEVLEEPFNGSANNHKEDNIVNFINCTKNRD
jgi:hypothetical protein